MQLKRHRRIVGKLHRVTIIFPDTKGLFSPINKKLKWNPIVIGLGKISKFKAALLDLSTMVILLVARTTHVKDIIPNYEQYYG